MQKEQMNKNEYEEVQGDEFLPLEILYHIFTYLDRQNLLKSMRVNKTWYYLVTGSKDLIASYLNESIAKQVELDDKTRQTLRTFTFIQLTNVNKRKTDLLNRSFQKRTQIALNRQIRLRNILHLVKETLRLIIVENVWPESVLGTPSLPKVSAYFFCLGTLSFLLEQSHNPEASFLVALLSSPLIIASGVANLFGYTIPIVLFSCLFAIKFYENFNLSREDFHQHVLEEIRDSSLNQVNVHKIIEQPVSLITMRWKRENIFSARENVNPKNEAKEIPELSYKKNV